MDVAADGDGAVERLDVGLLDEDVFGGHAEIAHFSFFDKLALFELRDLTV